MENLNATYPSQRTIVTARRSERDGDESLKLIEVIEKRRREKKAVSVAVVCTPTLLTSVSELV
jgi:hypothetical protein